MFFHPKKGIIALDIDGTVTSKAYEMDEKVIDVLTELSKEGWLLIFITGRPFQWGFITLEPLPFQYALAVQNGALLLEMPSRKILKRKYLSLSHLPAFEKIGQRYSTDFIVYSGFENQDCCYYKSVAHPSPEFYYGLKRAEFLGENWQSVSTFSELPVHHFSSIKFFAKDNRAFLISEQIEKEMGLHAPPNRDPFNPDYYVIQATHADATKGYVLGEFMLEKEIAEPIIAAGDDFNDLSMLEKAHIKIVMANAPQSLLDIANIIAPPADQNGIIVGLKEAIHRLNQAKG